MNLLVVKDESKEKIFSVRDVINIVNCLPIDDLLDDAFGNGKDDLIEIDDVSFSLDEKEIVFDDVDWSFKHNAISDISSEFEDALSETLEDKIRFIQENRDFAKNTDADYRICYAGGEFYFDKQEFDNFSSINEDGDRVLKLVQQACHSKTLGESDDLKVYYYCEDDFGGAQWVRMFAFYDDLGIVTPKGGLAIFNYYSESHLNRNSYDISLTKYNAEKEANNE